MSSIRNKFKCILSGGTLKPQNLARTRTTSNSCALQFNLLHTFRQGNLLVKRIYLVDIG